MKTTAPGRGMDLSSRICAQIERGPMEIVRCTRVQDDYYRCNWWVAVRAAPNDVDGWSRLGIGASHRIVRSSFLMVTCVDGTLNVRDASVGSNRYTPGTPGAAKGDGL